MKENILKINNERNIFWLLILGISISFSFYIYFVTSTIYSVVEREKLESEKSELALKISGKEFELIKKKNEITLSYAKSIGFVEVKNTKYITPKSVSFVATSQNEI